jgi:hypothetical protein
MPMGMHSWTSEACPRSRRSLATADDRARSFIGRRSCSQMRRPARSTIGQAIVSYSAAPERYAHRYCVSFEHRAVGGPHHRCDRRTDPSERKLCGLYVTKGFACGRRRCPDSGRQCVNSVALLLPEDHGQRRRGPSLHPEIGEMSLVDAAPQSTVAAKANCTAPFLDKRTLQRKLGENIGFAGRFYHALAIVLSDRLCATERRRPVNSCGLRTTA